ncbi:MAG: PEGA domain-containing protein [Porticoccaceae bacterium]|nr:PEGA domain-containing protein [Porticoccaceae bacterium]
MPFSDSLDSDSPSSDSQDSDSSLEAIDFEPIGTANAKPQGRFPLLPLAIAGVLLFSALILWFLLTSRTVSINTEPELAQIKISGGLSFALGGHHLLRPGQYRLQVSADGYRSYNEALLVTGEDNQSQSIQLLKLPGHLEIITTPDKASVFINGENKGLTPLTLADLAPDTYQLQITSPRYFGIEQAVDIEGLGHITQLQFQLKPAWGKISFRSEPPGATISVDGKNYGTTPGTAEVLASGEQVELSLLGYKAWQETLKIGVGENKEWPSVTLLPADSELQVASVPAGASITLNGQYLGSTPTTLALSPDTSHKLNVFLAGYEHSQTHIMLARGEQKTLNIKLTVKLGRLNITSKPTNAELYVDGTLRGTTPMTLNLPARPWRLEVHKSGYAPMSKLVSPKPGVQQAPHFALNTTQQSGSPDSPAMSKLITSPAGQTMKLFKPDSTFTMGASRREQGRRANEILHEVRLSRAFYLSTTEVSNAQFRKFDSQHSSTHVDGKTLDYLTQPVVNVNWTRAALYCNWLSKQDKLTLFYIEKDDLITGTNPEAQGYRLPTEAEWAWAARRQSDGSMRKFPWGNQFPPTAKTTNIADRSAANIVPRTLNTYNDSQAVSAPVSTYPANSKGLYDMGGNVAEWLNDYYSIAIATSGSAAIDPTGPDTGEYRVIRGPSWRHGGLSELRLSFRDYGIKARDDLGFRLARYAQ